MSGWQNRSRQVSPTRHRHGWVLWTDGARVARVRTVRRVSASGNWAFIAAFPVRPAFLSTTLVMQSRIVGLRRPRQSPKPPAAKDFWPCRVPLVKSGEQLLPDSLRNLVPGRCAAPSIRETDNRVSVSSLSACRRGELVQRRRWNVHAGCTATKDGGLAAGARVTDVTDASVAKRVPFKLRHAGLQLHSHAPADVDELVPAAIESPRGGAPAVRRLSQVRAGETRTRARRHDTVDAMYRGPGASHANAALGSGSGPNLK